MRARGTRHRSYRIDIDDKEQTEKTAESFRVDMSRYNVSGNADPGEREKVKERALRFI